MSEKVELARQPLLIRRDSRRSLDQRVFLRFPRTTVGILRIAWRFLSARPPGSRLRRSVVRFASQRGIEALNRGDLEFVSLWVHPEIESVNTPEVVALGGLIPGSRGRETWIAGQERWLEEWGEFRYEPDEVVDLGDHRLLFLGRVKATGGGSGVVIDAEWGLLATILNGQLGREQNFLNRAEALHAAGLSE